jgi:hypothetical protein
MQNYIDYVESLAISGEDENFFNSGPNHAAVVMSRIFKYSKDVVRIFCGGFTGAVSNDPDYLLYLEGFLQRGGKLKILAERNLSNDESLSIFKVLKKYKDNVEMFVTNLTVIMNSTDQAIHFTIGDQKMLRIETDTNNYAAQVNFGNSKSAETFIKLFDGMFDKPKETVVLA